MSKTILGSITKYPDVGDFDKIIFYIENIMLGDYNTISSRNYNRANNYFRNNNITGFNRKFIPNYAKIANILYNLTRTNVKFDWTDLHTNSFELLKERLNNQPTLAHSNFEFPFYDSVGRRESDCFPMVTA